MKMHTSNHHGHGVDKAVAHDFAINATGTHISFQFPPCHKFTFAGENAKKLRQTINDLKTKSLSLPSDGGGLTIIEGTQLEELREFLNRCELRTEEEAAALGEPPPESDAGKGKRIDLGDGTHAYAKTPEEEAQHAATAKANHERIHAEWYRAQAAAQAPPAPPEDHSHRDE